MQRTLVLALLVFAATLAPTAGFATSCSPSATRICLQDSRFGVEVAWTIPGGLSGAGHASPMTDDTGLFWFFSDSNLELVVKVLDGRIINGHFWVYYGGLSDVEYTITVTDHKTGATEIYHNPASQLASAADTSAFAAEPPAASGQVPFGMLGDALGTAQVPTAPAVPVRQGSELPVNVTTQGMQWHPAVAFGPDGGFMVVWSGDSPPYGLDVYGRFYDAQGNPRGGEIRLNDYRLGDQTHARVAAAPLGGGYLVVWEDGGVLVGRLYGADSGQPLGDAFRVGLSWGTQSSPDVVATGNGFVVIWVEDGLDPLTGDPTTTLWGQRLTFQGSRASATFGVSNQGVDPLSEPRLAASPGGGFVAVWINPLLTGVETDVLAARFDSTAFPIADPIRVNVVDNTRVPGLHQGALPLVYGDGSFSVLWTTSLRRHSADTEEMFARRYDASGAPQTGAVELRQELSPQRPAAALLPSGDALVLWYEAGRPADPDGGILARLFDRSWAPRGSEFRINAFTELTQTEPALALDTRDASGRLLAVWSSGLDISQGTPPFPGFVDNSQDGSGYGVFAQRFTTASCALASNQLCLNGRFRVDVQFTNPLSGDTRAAQAVPLTSDTGAFWFFGEDNLELMIKVLDGRAVNGHFWVYAGALSDVAYTITITDTESGQVKTYRNDLGQLASRADVEAF